MRVASKKREPRDLARRSATQAQGLRDAVAALQQERRRDDQPVGREQRELDERHEHAGSREMERVVGLVEDPGQVRLDVDLLSCRPALVQAASEPGERTPHACCVVEREIARVGLDAPAQGLIAQAELGEALACRDERAGSGGGKRLAPPKCAGGVLRTVRPDHARGDAIRRVEPLGFDEVADLQAEIRRDRDRQRDLHGASRRLGPPAGRERGMRSKVVDEPERDRPLLCAERLRLAARERRRRHAAERLADELAHAPVEVALGPAREHVDHELHVRVRHRGALQPRPEAALRDRVRVDRDRSDEGRRKEDDEERGAGHEPVGRGCLQGQAPTAGAHASRSGSTRQAKTTEVRVSARATVASIRSVARWTRAGRRAARCHGGARCSSPRCA